ncbi:hypothetical protein [Vibrio harveyi]|uniref:hypothetical protein n=1 Tax=Vibrio harveyi TaxID=669 RepID=UPI003CEA1CFE
MLLLETERFILETTFALQPLPTDAPLITLADCLPHLLSMIDEDKAVYSMRHDRAQMRITDYLERDYDEEGKGAVTLLLQFTDSDASDPSFGNMETGETRTVEKEEDEGLSVTAHLTIETHPINEGMPNVHNAVLEEVNGINKTNINSALTRMFRECTDLDFIDENTKKRKKCRPQVRLDVNAGHKLEELMQKGFVAGFKAVKYKAENKLDEEGDLEIQEESILLKSKKKRGKAALELIKKAAKFANDQQFSRLMVRYQDDNRKHKTFNISTREEDFANGLFGKSEKILLENVIQQCESEIHAELSEKMVNYLKKMQEE